MTEAASEIERDPLLEHVSESGHVSILAWLMLFYVFLPVLAHSLHKVLGFDNEILEAVHSPAHFLMLYICHSVPLLPKPQLLGSPNRSATSPQANVASAASTKDDAHAEANPIWCVCVCLCSENMYKLCIYARIYFFFFHRSTRSTLTLFC